MTACPLCSSPATRHLATQVTHADDTGSPVEVSAWGWYCDSRECEHHLSPIDE